MKTDLRLLLILFFIVFSFTLSWGWGEKPELASPKVAETAIDFTLLDLEGRSVKLSDYRGKVVFLNFWATWCPSCRTERPSMQKLYEKLKGENFEMLAVSIDRPGKSVVKPFVERGRYTFKILLDPEGTVASNYRIISIPTTFIIDKKGRVVEKVIGARDWAELSVVGKFMELIKNR